MIRLIVHCIRCGWRGLPDQAEGHACSYCGERCTTGHHCEED